MAERITFESRSGERITFTRPFILQRHDGFGGAPADIHEQRAPFQDGSSFLDAWLEPRDITLEGTITADSREELLSRRREMVRVLNPKLGTGILRWEQGDRTFEIEAVPNGGPRFPHITSPNMDRYLVALYCPNPFWLSAEHLADQLAAFEGGLSFPLQLPTTFAQQSESKSKIITNMGDVEAPLTITFFGPATAPLRVTNETTDEFIEVAQNLLEGERLVINTAFGKKSVVKIAGNGDQENAFHYINLQSTFFSLLPGNNLLSYSTGDEFERSPVQLAWRERYLGV